MEVGRRWHWQRTPHCWAHSCPAPPSRCQAELCSEVLGGASGGPMSSSPRLTCPVLGPAPPACAPGDRPRPPLGLACGGRSEHVHRKGHRGGEPGRRLGPRRRARPRMRTAAASLAPLSPLSGLRFILPRPSCAGPLPPAFPRKNGKNTLPWARRQGEEFSAGRNVFSFFTFLFYRPCPRCQTLGHLIERATHSLMCKPP